MNTSPCTNIEPRLPDYLAGTLPDAERAEIHAHLAGCPACREMADTLQLVSGAMSLTPLRETLDEARREQIHEALRTRGTRPVPARRWLGLLTWLNPTRAPSPALRLAMSVITFVVLPLCLIALLAPAMRHVKSRADHEMGWQNTAAPKPAAAAPLLPESGGAAAEATRKKAEFRFEATSELTADVDDERVPVPLEISGLRAAQPVAHGYFLTGGRVAPAAPAAPAPVESPAPAPEPSKPLGVVTVTETAPAPAAQSGRKTEHLFGQNGDGLVNEPAQAPAGGKDQQAGDRDSYRDRSRMREVVAKPKSGVALGEEESKTLVAAKKRASLADEWDADGDKQPSAAAIGGKFEQKEATAEPVLTGENSVLSLNAVGYDRVATPAPAAAPVITVSGGIAGAPENGRDENGREKKAEEKAAARPARPPAELGLTLSKTGSGALIMKGLAEASDFEQTESYYYDRDGREADGGARIDSLRRDKSGAGEGAATRSLSKSDDVGVVDEVLLSLSTMTNALVGNETLVMADAPAGDGPRPGAAREPAGFNPYTDAKQDAFSTFAIDVDTASYTLTRQALGEGRMPDPEEVRTEEIVNAFDYDYAPPAAGAFALHTELAPSPFRAPLELLKIGVQGKVIGRDAKRPAVLTLVIDGSGSMDTADRLGRIRRALHLLAGQLKPQDSIAIVQFSEQGRLLLDRTSGTNAAAVRAAVDALSANGSTDLEAGLRLGYEVAARGFRSGAANRVFLLSDGVANLGASSAQAILATVEQYRKQGIYLTVLGFGRGNYDDAMLEQLADKGDGQYAFVDTDAEAKRLLVDQWEQTLHVIARDVKIQVEFNPERVTRWRQVGYENRKLRQQDFRNDAVDAGEVGSGQSVTALYDLELTGDAGRPIATVRVRFKDPDTGAVTELEQRVTSEDRYRTFAAAPVRYRVAACAAEFAERLRVSPYAAGTDWDTLAATLRPAVLELPLDQRVQELLRLVEAARGLAE